MNALTALHPAAIVWRVRRLLPHALISSPGAAELDGIVYRLEGIVSGATPETYVAVQLRSEETRLRRLEQDFAHGPAFVADIVTVCLALIGLLRLEHGLLPPGDDDATKAIIVADQVATVLYTVERCWQKTALLTLWPPVERCLPIWAQTFPDAGDLYTVGGAIFEVLNHPTTPEIIARLDRERRHLDAIEARFPGGRDDIRRVSRLAWQLYRTVSLFAHKATNLTVTDPFSPPEGLDDLRAWIEDLLRDAHNGGAHV